jgi:hypothetical protein
VVESAAFPIAMNARRTWRWTGPGCRPASGATKASTTNEPAAHSQEATASRPSGEWNEDDFDVLADGVVVCRIFKANASPVGMSWMWTLAFGHHENRTPTHGYAATREAAMAAFAKSWRRE